MLKVVELKDIVPSNWDALVRASSVATWFQTKEAYDFFDSLSFLEVFALGVERDGRLTGVVVGSIQKDGGKLKQYLSRRAIINGGPLLDDNITDKELSMLLNALKSRLGRKTIYIETRNFNDYGRWRHVFEDCGFGYEPHYDVLVETSTIESVNNRLDRNRKRNIKKANENGLVIDQSVSDADLFQFYQMLDELYRSKVKTPLWPFEFFQRLKNLESAHFFMAKDSEGKLIGGLVCLALESRIMHALFACGDDQNYRALSPSVMVNYAGICYAAEHGFSQFDFMGAGKPDDGGYGVRDFKMKFGGELVELGRFVHVCNHLLFAVGKFGVKVLKKL
jgi:hypothetical protein